MKRLSYYTNLKNKNQFLKLTKIEVASRKAKEKKEREDALDHKLMNKCRGMDENGAPLPVKFNTTPTIIFAGVDEKTLEREKQIMSTREVAATGIGRGLGAMLQALGRSLPAPRPRVREYVPGGARGKTPENDSWIRAPGPYQFHNRPIYKNPRYEAFKAKARRMVFLQSKNAYHNARASSAEERTVLNLTGTQGAKLFGCSVSTFLRWQMWLEGEGYLELARTAQNAICKRYRRIMRFYYFKSMAEGIIRAFKARALRLQWHLTRREEAEIKNLKFSLREKDIIRWRKVRKLYINFQKIKIGDPLEVTMTPGNLFKALFDGKWRPWLNFIMFDPNNYGRWTFILDERLHES